MARIDTIVVGASAGGVEALTRLVQQLPESLDAVMLIVLHMPESSRSMLPHILDRNSKMPVKTPNEGEEPEPGRIYVAPPGRHMLLRENRIRLLASAKENGHRPAIDPLFRTAARSCGPSVAGVILSGMLDDGTLGIGAIRQYGGVTIAQSPNDAMYPDMPRNAIMHSGVDYALPLAEIGELLVRLTSDGEYPIHTMEENRDASEMTMPELSELEKRGRPSTFTCPECHGTLFELDEDGMVHYRCRVGHAYAPESLEHDQEVNLEAVLWTALRAIVENNALVERIVNRNKERGLNLSASSFERKLEEGKRRAELLRNALDSFTALKEPAER